MKNLINFFKFWQFFRKHLELDFCWYEFYEKDSPKVRLRVYNAWPKSIYEAPLHDITLSSRSECKAEFLARLDGETPMQVWDTWVRPTKEDMFAGQEFYYFYGGYQRAKNEWYEKLTLTTENLEYWESDEHYLDLTWARIAPRVQNK